MSLVVRLFVEVVVVVVVAVEFVVVAVVEVAVLLKRILFVIESDNNLVIET